jgi:uncharacterized protein (DUF2126 family)
MFMPPLDEWSRLGLVAAVERTAARLSMRVLLRAIRRPPIRLSHFLIADPGVIEVSIRVELGVLVSRRRRSTRRRGRQACRAGHFS